MLRLKNDEAPADICVDDLRDGELGVITSWVRVGYIGTIVQRYKNYLIAVGQRSGLGWGRYFNGQRNELCRVRILKPGEELIVVGE